jgi:hypothetical protein
MARPSCAIFWRLHLQPARQHTRSKGITAADAIDDIGDLDFRRLMPVLAQVHAGREAVMGLRNRMARRAGHDLKARKSRKGRLDRLTPTFRAIAGKGLLQQQRHVAVIAEHDRRLGQQFQQDLTRIAVPRAPEFFTEITVEADRNARRSGRLDPGAGQFNPARTKRRRDAGDVEQCRPVERGGKVELLRHSGGKGRTRTVIGDGRGRSEPPTSRK